MSKLTQDEREALAELLHSDGFPALLKELDALVADMERRVVAYNMDPPGADRELVLAKCRAEGARRLYTAAVGHFTRIKGQ
jgi:predicted kinase